MKKNVLITGANGGIGRALVEKYAENGYNILANIRCENEAFSNFSENIENKYNVKVKQLVFDVTDELQVKQAIKDLVKANITIDVLINNAGVAHGGLLQMTPIGDIKKVFDVNYFSVVLITQLISRMMAKSGGGSIINIASVAGIDLEAGNCAYGASKAALIAFTKTASKELAKYRIRVNAIAPGLTDTAMAKLMNEDAGNEMKNRTAMKRLSEPKEIADAVFYIGSEQATFITGQVLRVDGGM